MTEQWSTYVGTWGFDFCIWPDRSPFAHLSKSEWSPSVTWLYSLGVHAGDRIHLEAACDSRRQFVQLAQSSAAFYTALQADVHQSQLQTAQLPCLWTVLITCASWQFHLQCSPGVFYLRTNHSALQRWWKGDRVCRIRAKTYLLSLSQLWNNFGIQKV